MSTAASYQLVEASLKHRSREKLASKGTISSSDMDVGRKVISKISHRNDYQLVDLNRII